jgi:hypothetical protein
MDHAHQDITSLMIVGIIFVCGGTERVVGDNFGRKLEK